MDSKGSHIISFPPISDRNSRVLILGTMPGRLSIHSNEYYKNPENSFWDFISNITSVPYNDSYESKTKMLHTVHIAVWDVLRHCERESSLDKDIKNEYPNDF